MSDLGDVLDKLVINRIKEGEARPIPGVIVSVEGASATIDLLAKDSPRLREIPIFSPLGLTYPVEAGNKVLVIPLGVECESFRRGEEADTLGSGQGYGDAIALLMDAKAPSAVFGVGGGANWVAIAEKVDLALDTLRDAINTHIHPHPQGPTSATLDQVAPLDPTKSENLKAK